jgi:hypothetical protein
MEKQKDTICWDCKHATNKYKICSWANEFKPVKGWNADKMYLLPCKTQSKKLIESYLVKSCPLFEKG